MVATSPSPKNPRDSYPSPAPSSLTIHVVSQIPGLRFDIGLSGRGPVLVRYIRSLCNLRIAFAQASGTRISSVNPTTIHWLCEAVGVQTNYVDARVVPRIGHFAPTGMPHLEPGTAIVRGWITLTYDQNALVLHMRQATLASRSLLQGLCTSVPGCSSTFPLRVVPAFLTAQAARNASVKRSWPHYASASLSIQYLVHRRWLRNCPACKVIVHVASRLVLSLAGQQLVFAKDRASSDQESRPFV